MYSLPRQMTFAEFLFPGRWLRSGHLFANPTHSERSIVHSIFFSGDGISDVIISRARNIEAIHAGVVLSLEIGLDVENTQSGSGARRPSWQSYTIITASIRSPQ